VAREHPELTPSASFTFMVVEVKISYRSPGQFGDRIETRLRPSTVGRSSFHMDFEMRVSERLLADGYSVLVSYDPVAGRSIAVPQPLRERLIADGAQQR
jgi:acyl-CoA thioesterase FadM